jgi:hypothetical protein
MAGAADYATWIFPRPGLTIPGFPTSENRSLARWYLEYCLTNETSAMDSKMRAQLAIHVGDVLEPYWVDSSESIGSTDAVNVVRLFCLRCDEAWDKFPCKADLNSTTGAFEVSQTLKVSTPASRYRITLPGPDVEIYNGSRDPPVYSCALQRESSLDKQGIDLDRQAFSEVFFVWGYARVNDRHHIHNLSNSEGVPFIQDDEEQADVPAFVFPPASAMKASYGNGFLSWPSSQRINEAMRKPWIYSRDEQEPVFQMPANIQADDVLEPRWIEHSSRPVKSLGLACIVCPEKNGTAISPPSHCDKFDGRKVTEFYLPIELLSPGGAGMEVRMPSSRSFEAVAACAFHLNFSIPSSADVVVSSQVFFVADGSLVRKEQHRFNLTQIAGAPTGMYRDDLSDGKSTDFYSSFGSASRGSRKLTPGAIAGIVLGSISSCILTLWLWKCWRRKTEKTEMGNRVGPSRAERNAAAHSEADIYLALQPRGEREVATSLPQSGTRAHADPIRVANGERITEETFAEPPPAYHEVVKNSR